MENMNMIWLIFVLPCFAGIFKKEIGNLWTAWCIYKDRPFDEDRNPTTPDICLMCNPATGKWSTIVIHHYQFWKLKSSARGVTFSHVVKDGLQERHVGLIEWGGMAKSKLIKPMNPKTAQLLERHQAHCEC